MHLLNYIILFASMLSVALAKSATTPMISPSYYLKVDIINPKPNNHSHFNGQYLQSYHIGAGLSDVVLTPRRMDAAVGYLNGSYQLFNLSTEFPWEFVTYYDVGYSGWSSMKINAGYGYDYGTYFINKTGLQYRTSDAPETDGFGGWRVCDWWHNEPQLFWKLSYYNNTLPANCEDANLIPVFLKE